MTLPCLEWVSYWVIWASLAAQMVKSLPAMRETWVQSLGWEDPLGRESILAWDIKRSLAGYIQSMGSQRVRHD